MTQTYLSVVIPAFNEEVRIASTVKSIVGYLSEWLPDSNSSRNWEVLVVNDGSSDSTVSIVVKLSESDGRIKLIDLPHGGREQPLEEVWIRLAGSGDFCAMLIFLCP